MLNFAIKDSKFQWLVLTCLMLTVFEFLSLGGIHLPPKIAIPFFGVVILAIGKETILNGLLALLSFNLKSINLLMIIAVTGAFYLGEYEEAAIVIVLYNLAERLEDLGIITSKSALTALIDRMPKTILLKDIPAPILVADIKIGNVMRIKPGDMIPLDGKVEGGSSSVDESTITGEPIPIDKHVGDSVFAGTLNIQGYLEVIVEKVMKDSTLSKIQELTFQATQAKAKTQKFIETFSLYYTPTILILAVLIGVVLPFVLDKPFDPWFSSALSLIVISCPCALVISTPISIYSAIGNASSKGALIKGGRYLEAIGKVRCMALDKTRTLTRGQLKVTDIIPFGSSTREDLISCAAGIEQFSEHPIAQSIVHAALQEEIHPHQVDNFASFPGKGAKADCLVCYDKHHCIGKLQFILEEHAVPQEVVKKVDTLQQEGKTVIVVSTHKEVEGIIALADEIRPESHALITSLHDLGIVPIMLTGDHPISSQSVARKIGINEVKAELLPQDKARVIADLLKIHRYVGMVGDGVNDAPALALADVGISLSELGSDAAIDAASIVILSDRLKVIPFLIRLGRKTIKIIKINTFFAVMVKLLFVCLALVGISNLAMAIFADVGVTLLVILNSLRLMQEEKEKRIGV